MRALGVGSVVAVGFTIATWRSIGSHWVRSRTALESLNSSGVVVFTCAHPGCRWVQAHALGVVGLTRVRSVGNPGWLGSLGRWVRSGAPWWSLGSLAYAFGVIVFMRGRWGLSCTPWVLLKSSVVVGFTLARWVFVGFVRGK